MKTSTNEQAEMNALKAELEAFRAEKAKKIADSLALNRKNAEYSRLQSASAVEYREYFKANSTQEEKVAFDQAVMLRLSQLPPIKSKQVYA